jgi:hypothetical protein
MTNFKKDNFYFDGSFLTYNGSYEGSQNMDEFNPNCHPSWIGKMKPAFIARFKYGRKPYKTWINFLVKNATVEQYLKLAEENTPLDAMRMLGFKK